MSDETTIRAKLERDRERVQARIAGIQGAERKETSDDQTDNAHLWEDADIRDGDLDEAVEELGAIDDALQRFDLGSYGVCVTCGEPIPDARLEVMPYAVKCVKCADS